MSQICQLVGIHSLVRRVSLFSVVSWSSRDNNPDPTADLTAELTPELTPEPTSVCIAPRSVDANEIQNSVQFVCVACGYKIGNSDNIFFMLDSTYCSRYCRTASLYKSDDTVNFN